jgi:hypothetical protein
MTYSTTFASNKTFVVIFKNLIKKKKKIVNKFFVIKFYNIKYLNNNRIFE